MLTITDRQMDAMAEKMPGSRMIVPCADTRSWISIELLDADEKPVAAERYLIRLPDAARMAGRLGPDGRARVDGIVPGSCQVSFPDIDAREWFPA